MIFPVTFNGSEGWTLKEQVSKGLPLNSGFVEDTENIMESQENKPVGHQTNPTQNSHLRHK